MSTIIQYENRVVFFFDILGFRDLIEKQSIEKGIDCTTIYDVFNYITDFYKDEIDDKYPKSKKITFFSDCIIISFVENEPDQVFSTVSNIRILLANLIQQNIVMRGGISYGKLFHSEKYIFGPAFIEAYLIEKDKAKFPRIICDTSILVLSQKGKSLHSAKQDLEIFTEIVQKDDDGFWFIDYIEGLESLFDDGYEHIDYLMTLRKFIKNSIDNSKDESIKQKYLWMKAKFNKVSASIIDNNNRNKLEDYELSEYIKQLSLIE